MKITEKIEKKLGLKNIVELITGGLSGSELNSLYLELFSKQCSKLESSDILKNYHGNRFVTPSDIDIISFKEREIIWLKKAVEMGFIPVALSPVTPIGTSSVVGLTHQNNVVSAVRGTEVLSDATNVLALQIADDFKKSGANEDKNYCTTHRHLRAQSYSNPAFLPHFGLFCMVTGGLDKGNSEFELKNIDRYMRFYCALLLRDFPRLTVKIYPKTDNEYFRTHLLKNTESIPGNIKVTEDENDGTENYYKTVRIKIFVKYKDFDFDLVDMGFVDWTQKLLNNRKHRLLISGAGLELLYKMQNAII